MRDRLTAKKEAGKWAVSAKKTFGSVPRSVPSIGKFHHRISNRSTLLGLMPYPLSMNGISFVVDERGRKKAVLIDLDRYGETWEDFHDALIVKARRREPREPLSEVEKRLARRRRA